MASPFAQRQWRPPHGILRLALRLPIALYRLRLGWLLGHRFLLLTHRGRKTGGIYSTVLEVLQYDPQTRESIVLSGWGTQANWYRNIQASPPVEVRTGRLRYAPKPRILPSCEAAAVAARWERDHPWEARLASRLFRWTGIAAGDAATRPALPTTLPMVALRPRDDDVAIASGA